MISSFPGNKENILSQFLHFQFFYIKMCEKHFKLISGQRLENCQQVSAGDRAFIGRLLVENRDKGMPSPSCQDDPRTPESSRDLDGGKAASID
jgi:hypothetical protein